MDEQDPCHADRRALMDQDVEALDRRLQRVEDVIEQVGRQTLIRPGHRPHELGRPAGHGRVGQGDGLGHGFALAERQDRREVSRRRDAAHHAAPIDRDPAKADMAGGDEQEPVAIALMADRLPGGVSVEHDARRQLVAGLRARVGKGLLEKIWVHGVRTMLRDRDRPVYQRPHSSSGSLMDARKALPD